MLRRRDKRLYWEDYICKTQSIARTAHKKRIPWAIFVREMLFGNRHYWLLTRRAYSNWTRPLECVVNTFMHIWFTFRRHRHKLLQNKGKAKLKHGVSSTGRGDLGRRLKINGGSVPLKSGFWLSNSWWSFSFPKENVSGTHFNFKD